ncbi:MAG: Rpn family recombination-promoting nuclease/putative transposase [Gammaproteobacteria bacterium]
MNYRIVSPHDRFFRFAMAQKEVAKEFFEQHLPPAIQQVINFDTLKMLKESFMDEKLNTQISDALFSVDFAEQPGYIYLLAEHKSKPDYWLPLYLLKAIVLLMEQHRDSTRSKKLPVIFPIIFYNGEKPYTYSTDILDLFNDPLQLMKTILFRPFQLVDVGRIPDEELRQRTWLSVLELTMKHIYDKDIHTGFKMLIEALHRVAQQGGLRLVEGTLIYLFNAAVDIRQSQELIKTIQQDLLSKSGEEVMTTLAEHLQRMIIEGRAAGEAEGRAEGKAEGRTEGEAIGFEKGRFIERQALAHRLIEQGFEPETVASLTGLLAHEFRESINE